MLLTSAPSPPQQMVISPLPPLDAQMLAVVLVNTAPWAARPCTHTGHTHSAWAHLTTPAGPLSA